MSRGVSNVSYSYAVGTIGFEDIEASRTISAGSSLQNIYNAYKGLFDDYSKIHGTLLAQMNAVLGKTYSGELDLATVFDENVLIDIKSLEAGQCKEGAKAYKYYLREVITQLNTLWSWKTQAADVLEQLNALIGREDPQEDLAHPLITQLEIADQHVQDAIKAFTKHTVIKDLTITKIVCDSSNPDMKNFDCDNFTAYETDYDGVVKKNSGNYKYESKLDGIDTLEGLRNLKTTKYAVNRSIITQCYKDAEMTELADEYDDLVYRKTSTVDSPNEEETGYNKGEKTDAIALFDELSLLDKLNYITLYYKNIDEWTPGYIFPNDAATGFPCVKPKDSESPTEDTNEVGQLEMFYIGYLVDRDGPVNALASFMEVKSTAIKEQIVLLSYRVKALQYYIKLLNKGLEKLTESQSEGRNSIPVVSCWILRLFGANVTRSLGYLKDYSGNYLNSGNPYIFAQYTGDTPDTGNGYHTATYYMLIETTDEGVESFLNCINEFNDSTNWDDYIGERLKKITSVLYYISNKRISLSLEKRDEYKILFFKFGDVGGVYGNCLPKELDVSRLDMTTLVSDNFGGVSGMSWKGGGSDVNWTTFISTWTTQYDTVISNYQSQLEYEQKSIASLRKKIDTFDSMASNFRNKAYSIYNKIVSKIS